MRNTTQRLMATCLVTALFVGFVGCGSAPAEDTGAVVGNTGGQLAPVAAGGAGRSAAGGAAPGGLPQVMMTSVPCGTATCSGIMAMGLGAAPCCADPATNACGNVMNGACAAKPMIAELCPKIPPVFGMTINACCQPDGTCGVDGSALGRGCTSSAGLAMFGGTPPPPAMCDGTLIAGPAAAGTGAAGTSAAAGSSAAGSSAAGSSAAGSSAGAAGARAGAGGSSAGAAGARAGAGGSTTSTGAAGARAGAGGAAGR